MSETKSNTVWIFHGEGGRFSGGVFTSVEKAQIWIEYHKLTGLLTEYPLDEVVFDWAIKNELFKVKTEKHTSPGFIQSFTTGSQEHFHFESGEME